VPENRAEITTEGGMDLTKDVEYFKEFIEPIQNAGFIASYFIDPDLEQVTAAYECESKSIELHTGKYANLFLEDENLEYYAKNRKLHISVLSEVERLKQAAEKAINLGIKVNLGHGLTPNNLSQMLKIPQVSELHIGHSIIANSIFLGIKDSVGEFLKQINA
jgi:pyridoxine 5-phosphate synthase